jgi:hypothetical protein
MFTGKVDMIDVARFGRIVLDTQEKMAAQRVKTNSRVGTILIDQDASKDRKVTVAITNAPDLTLGTHAALAELGTDVTVTTAFRYGRGSTQLTVSVRAQNENVDVRELVRTLSSNSGDSRQVAGGGVEVGFEAIPFMQSFKDVEL